MTERKTYTCNACGRIDEAKAAKDWPQVKHAGTIYHFCADPCLQRWTGELPRQLELPALSADPVRLHEPRAAYGREREDQ